VIAYSRGCIEQIISDQVGLQLAPVEDYVAGAVSKIGRVAIESAGISVGISGIIEQVQ